MSHGIQNTTYYNFDHIVENKGQKKFVAVTYSNMTRLMTAQVAEGVTNGLLSVIKAMDAGNRVVFDSEGSYILGKSSAEWMTMRDDGKMFLLKLWVKNQGF